MLWSSLLVIVWEVWNPLAKLYRSTDFLKSWRLPNRIQMPAHYILWNDLINSNELLFNKFVTTSIIATKNEDLPGWKQCGPLESSYQTTQEQGRFISHDKIKQKKSLRMATCRTIRMTARCEYNARMMMMFKKNLARPFIYKQRTQRRVTASPGNEVGVTKLNLLFFACNKLNSESKIRGSDSTGFIRDLSKSRINSTNRCRENCIERDDAESCHGREKWNHFNVSLCE